MKLGRPALARGALDRAADRRQDEQWLAGAWDARRTRVLVVDGGKALVRLPGTPGSAGESGPPNPDGCAPGGGSTRDGAELVLISPAEAPGGPRILLGVDRDGVAYFAVFGPLGGETGEGIVAVPGGEGDPGAARVIRAGLREVGALLGDRDAGLFTHAVALSHWHATHQHCPRCGVRTALSSAGHARSCPEDGSEHFPRVDPAVIMLVLDPADRCLLARNVRWPERRVSILAGFVEPGESVEQAVAREVREEVGITVGEQRYLGSQPWPMPQSLMLAFSARVVARDGDKRGPRTEICVDSDEIASARWYSRDDLRRALGAGEILLPPPVSIAYRIIEAWYGAPLPVVW